MLALITGVNLWGVAESARVFIVPTVAFIVSMAVVIVGGLFRSKPDVLLAGEHLPQVTAAVGLLLLLKAFASGCSALTGVEAIANAVPEFSKPRARRAQHTEMWLGILLGAMLIGISVLIRKFHVGAVGDRDHAGPADRRRRGAQHHLLRDPADHHGAAGAGREHLVRRPPGPGVACWPGTTTCRTCSG